MSTQSALGAAWDEATSALIASLPVPIPVITDHPDVYRPAVDSALLCLAVAEEFRLRGSGGSALELCAGSAVASLYAARWATDVTAVDRNPAAVEAMRANARANGVRLDARCADITELECRAADVVFANPPYVPAPTDTPPSAHGFACDGGEHGRDVIDAIIDRGPMLVRPGGTMLLVHSAISGVDHTVAALGAAGFDAAVQQRWTIPFGPVMDSRAGWLAKRGLITWEQRHEDLVVVRARRPW